MEELFNKLNIKPKDIKLYNTAFSHSSYANEHKAKGDYEKLEFLGDSVVDLVIADYLYSHNSESEGEMTKIRASYVCENALYEYSKKINLIPYVKVGHGLDHTENETIIADVFEAVLAVIYLDKGFEVAKDYIYKVIIPFVKEKRVFLSDYKSHLQEMVQTEKKSLEYVLIEETGPAHDKRFKVNVLVDNIVFGTGIGRSKKEAEQNAAKDAIKKAV